jgi:hypothetical protein
MQGHNRLHATPVLCPFLFREGLCPFIIQIFIIQSIVYVKNERTIFPETGHTILPVNRICLFEYATSFRFSDKSPRHIEHIRPGHG